jgi:hypothetical protein
VKTELLAPELVAEICKPIPQRLAAQTRQTESNNKRIAELEAENARPGGSIGGLPARRDPNPSCKGSRLSGKPRPLERTA